MIAAAVAGYEQDVRARLQAAAMTLSLVVLPLAFAIGLGPALAAGAGRTEVVLTTSPAADVAASTALGGAGGTTRLVVALVTSLALSAGVWLTVSAARRFD